MTNDPRSTNHPRPVEASSTGSRPVEASSTGQPTPEPIYQSPSAANSPWPVEASSTGQEPITTNESLITPRPSGEDEINLLDYLRVIYRYKWMIMVITIGAMAVTVALSLSRPRMYQASTSIVPPTGMRSPGGLASELGSAGSSLLRGMLGVGSGDLSDVYMGILKSRAVSDALIDRFDLMTVNEQVIPRMNARKTLNNNTRIQASDEGIVHVTVEDSDPNRAAALSNAYVEELDRQNKRLSGSQTTSKRVFLENRLKEIQDELSKIENLQSREVRIKEIIFEMLTQECEIAKIEEAKNMPTIQVLDRAVVPERGMRRGTVKKGISAGIAALMLGGFWALACEYFAGVRAGRRK